MINIDSTHETPENKVMIKYSGESQQETEISGKIFIPKDEFEMMAIPEVKQRIKEKILNEMFGSA